MARVAIVSPVASLRRTLVELADEGCVQLDEPGRGRPEGAVSSRTGARTSPRLSLDAPDAEECRRSGREDLLAGEAELARYLAGAARQTSVAGVCGWTPETARATLACRLAPWGGSVVVTPRPRGVDPPSLLDRKGVTRSFAPLLDTYGTLPYADLDPSLLAGLAYIVMFGMMFADVGQGALLVVGALLARRGWPRRAARLRVVWPFLAGAGFASMVFGLLYGECFGPTGLVPVLWLRPLDHPVPLLLAGVVVGAVLLSGAYALGVVNRVREGGWALALYSPSGIAGALLFLALGVVVAGWYAQLVALVALGGFLAVAALGLAFAGLYAGAGGGGAGASQAIIELVDLVIRLASNLVSFARLAAFGLTHAALGLLVWEGARSLWQRGGAMVVLAVVVFVAGNLLTFTLEAVVAGIQALRLEYYELFSRVFQAEGRSFTPWHIPIQAEEGAS